MGYVVAALVIILAIVVAVAIAKLLLGLLVLAAGVVIAIYLWYRLTATTTGPNRASR